MITKLIEWIVFINDFFFFLFFKIINNNKQIDKQENHKHAYFPSSFNWN